MKTDNDMPVIRIKDITQPPNRLVYQGPAEHGCEAVGSEGLVQVWASDPGWQHGSLELFLSVPQARELAKHLLQRAAEVERESAAQ